MRMTILMPVLIGLLAPFIAFAQEVGFSVNNMDLTMDPTQDFVRYATGRWMDRTEIPDDKRLIMDASVLLDSLNETLLDIARTSAAATGAAKTGNVQLVGDFYTAGMDMTRRDALGLRPLETLLARVNAAGSPRQLAELAAQVESQFGNNPFLNASVDQDRQQTDQYVLIVQSDVTHLGFGLTRDEYVNPDKQQIRDNYTNLITRLLELAGDEPETARRSAEAALAFEAEVAQATMTPVQAADPNATYNKFSREEFKALLPAFDLDAYFAALGVTFADTVRVGDRGAIEGMQQSIDARSSAELQALLRTYVIRTSAGLLGGEFYQAARDYQRVKSGLATSPPREKEVTDLISNLMAHPYSQLYVAGNFSPGIRETVLEMADRIRNEFRKRIETNDWLTDSTRATALAKLERVSVMAGYPEHEDDWIDYSGVRIAPDDFFGNVLRLREFEKRRNLDLLGKPVEIDQFTYPGRTTPISMNAGLHQLFLVVYVPAAYVQPPHYVEANDAAANFGALGAIMGHEMTHAFDSTGRNYDVNGNLRDWWTPEDAAEFQKRADMLVRQFDAYEVAPGLHVNGEFTLGENIADLGGLTLAYNALQTYMQEQGRLPDIDGLTPEQRFFAAWAQLWMAKTRPETLQLAVAIDPHAPAEVRTFGPVVNMDAFFETFGIEAGDAMWKRPEDRVSIW